MEHFLLFLSFILLFIVLILMFNEKTLKLPSEIALLAGSLLIGVALLVLKEMGIGWKMDVILETIDRFRIDKVLMDILLCFMLFSGASELRLKDLAKNFKPISLLALGTTLISSALFGLVFWALSAILHLGMSYSTCVLIGAIVSPTDPIAATGILSKLGLSEDIIATIEGESLFNDGTGVALFIFLKDLICDTNKSNFFVIMGMELGGAILVGLVVSVVFFFIMKLTKDPLKLIIMSLATVAVCYSVCELFGFSGVIASVICGIYFSTMKEKWHNEDNTLDPEDWYREFWHIIDKLFNYALYVLMGISLIYMSLEPKAIVVAVVALFTNFGARYAGVYLTSLLVKQNPGGFNNKEFTLLLTWGGLKGGLCLALALSTAKFLDASICSYIMAAAISIVLFTTLVQGLSISKVYKVMTGRNAK